MTPAAARAAAGGSLAPSSLTAGDQAQFHLCMLNHPNGFLEIRHRTDHGMTKTFYLSPDEAATAAVRLADTTDVYVGAMPRLRRGGGDEDVTPVTRTLWCDCDNQMAVERCLNWEFRPHFAVESSPGRAHFYWFIEPLPVALVARANRRLAFLFGGDLRCGNPSRILRVAGTKNWKRDSPTDVVLCGERNGQEYTSRQLVGQLKDPAAPKVKVPRGSTRKFDDPSKDALLSVRSHDYVERLTGREANSAGMVQCPFHKGGAERTPSLHIGGPHDTLWFCHGCGEGGDIFSLAERVWGGDFPSLVKRLEGMF